jgi:hypothetical protein
MGTNTSSIAVSALGRIEIHLSFIASGPSPRIGDTDTDDPDAGAGECASQPTVLWTGSA